MGGVAALRFVKDGNPVNMGFRIDETTPNACVRWACVTHDMPSWIGTSLIWRLAEAGGATVVSFEHTGWKGLAPDAVAQGWKHFLGSLKSYVETGTGQARVWLCALQQGRSQWRRRTPGKPRVKTARG
ncbi:MAG: hypothetical protein RJA70_1229 [Pseudomonadota bacterium]